MRIVKGALSAVAIAALMGPAVVVLPTAQAATNHEVSVACNKDVHITGVPGDTYTFTFTGFCLDPASNSEPDPGFELDQLAVMNANATRGIGCDNFLGLGFFAQPTATVVDGSVAAGAFQTRVFTSYCYATEAEDSRAQFQLPADTPVDQMDWYIWTNFELPNGSSFVRASGVRLLQQNALGASLAEGSVVATISNNKLANTWRIIYDGITSDVPPADPTIVIAKSRAGAVVTIKGATTGFTAGSKVTPHFKTSVDGEFVAGKKITVAAKGKCTWNKNVKKKTTLWVYFTGKGVTSNTVQVKP